jgi:predicted ATPase with chaperone activity
VKEARERVRSAIQNAGLECPTTSASRSTWPRPICARSALEALREALETGIITIARAARRAEFPARFQLVAAMNPCPCGYLGSALKTCRCTPDQVARYQGKLSGPLLDRIDLHIEVPAVSAQQLLEAPAGEATGSIRGRVVEARERAVQRQGQAQPRPAGCGDRQACRARCGGAQVHAQRGGAAGLVGAQHAPCAEGRPHDRRPGRRRRSAGGARGGGGAIPQSPARGRVKLSA